MTEVNVSRDDIEVLAQAVATLPEAPKELLSAIVTAIRDVAGDVNEAVVTVTVDAVTELQDEFASAFTADTGHAAAAGVGVRATFMKIGRAGHG